MTGPLVVFHAHPDDESIGTGGVIALCSAMMAVEIVGGLLFGSIALVADGLHMSTRAGALLLAAPAGTARRSARPVVAALTRDSSSFSGVPMTMAPRTTPLSMIGA